MKPIVFISYCHKDEKITDEIDSFLQSKNIETVRDKKDLLYKGSIKDFMKKIRETDYVLMIISDHFLKSKNCMSEVLEFLKDDNYKKRIILIILNKEKIYEIDSSIEYVEYWENISQELIKKMDKINPINNIPLQQEIKEIRNISSSISEFIYIIKDMKNISFEDLIKSNFEILSSLIPEISFPYIKDLNYTIIKQKDISHAGAKRYSAQVVVDRSQSREDIKKIIKKVTENLRKSNYYRDDISKAHWQNTEAHVVWLFIAFDLEDTQTFNWVCRTSWISKSLDKDMSPMIMEGNDQIDDIIIDWNNSYEEKKGFYKKHFSKKEDYLEKVNSILEKMTNITERAIEKFDSYRNNNLTEEEFIKYVQNKYETIDDLYNESDKILLPPIECKNYDQIVQNLFSDIHNMFLYYSKRGLENWDKNNRAYLINSSIESYRRDSIKLKYEKGNLN